MFLTAVNMDLCKCTGGKLCNIALDTFTTQPNDVPLLPIWRPSFGLEILTIANCPMQTEDEQLRNQFILRHHCLYHVQSCSNFTRDCKITMFTSRSKFQRRESRVWERDCTTSALTSIWSASDGESLSGMRQEGKTTLEWSDCYTRPVCWR